MQINNVGMTNFQGLIKFKTLNLVTGKNNDYQTAADGMELNTDGMHLQEVNKGTGTYIYTADGKKYYYNSHPTSVVERAYSKAAAKPGNIVDVEDVAKKNDAVANNKSGQNKIKDKTGGSNEESHHGVGSGIYL